MPASVTLHDLTYSTPDSHTLFTGLHLSFGNERTGLIGRNGTGKSTLLKLISGDLVPQAGTVSVSGTLEMLRQSVQVDGSMSVAQHLGVDSALAILDRLEAGHGSEADFIGADWTLPSRIESTLAELSLPPLAMDRPVGRLSGGQRTRLSLVRLLLSEPDMILLDEPTNNLDAEGRQAVGELLARWRGGAIVVSHDRDLLGQMDCIVELTTLGAKTYGGNWELYQERKALELASAEHQRDTAERHVVQIDRKLQALAERKARKDGAGKRKAARGDIPRIMLGGMKENAENTSASNIRLASRLRTDAAEAAAEARAQLEVLTPLSMRLVPTGLPAGRTVLEARGLTGGPDPDHPVVRDFALTMTGPERVALTGPNGVGKTTLLRLLTGDLAPQDGSARITVPHAFLDQTVGLLDPALTIADNFRHINPGSEENTVRAALARFMFRADAALQLVGTLSGGETLRAALAATIGGDTPPQLLILDEPTNHLDIHAIEQIEAGLRSYDGALLVVSHERPFLQAIGIEREIALTPGGSR